MTPEERQMLTELADKIARTPTPAHDPEADEFIRTKIGQRPDALYILTQTTLIQNLAIQHAQEEIQGLKQRLTQPAQPAPAQPGSGFLGGGAAPPARPAGPPAYAPSPYPPSNPQSYGPPVPPPLPQYAQAAPEAPSFLRSAAQTAAGVAAGALAFEGIRSLFSGGFGGMHLGGFGGGPVAGGSFLGGAPGGETIINNYYDSPDTPGRDLSDAADANLAADPNLDDASLNDNVNDASAPDDANVSYDDPASNADDSPTDQDYADAGNDAGNYDDGGGSGGDSFA